MSRWFTSDLHLGHSNIIRYCGRPYSDVNTMNTAVLEAINSQVESGDELWILGDVAMGDVTRNVPLLRQINCNVHIVAGKHDRCHPYNGAKSEGYVELYRDHSGASTLTLTNTTLELATGLTVNISHFPYAATEAPQTEARMRTTQGVFDAADRYAPWRPVDDGAWLLCGHVHERWQQRGRVINVGVDAWGGHPVPEATILEMTSARPTDREVHPW